MRGWLSPWSSICCRSSASWAHSRTSKSDTRHNEWRLPSVSVFKAHDVVFAEIGAGLHFDKVQRDAPRIFQPMARAERNIGRLIFPQEKLLVATGDFGGARDDDPVLGAMMMHLERKLGARIDDNAFDLETLAVIDGIVRAPRPKYLPVMQMVVMA